MPILPQLQHRNRSFCIMIILLFEETFRHIKEVSCMAGKEEIVSLTLDASTFLATPSSLYITRQPPLCRSKATLVQSLAPILSAHKDHGAPVPKISDPPQMTSLVSCHSQGSAEDGVGSPFSGLRYHVKNANPITLLVHAGSRFHRKLDEALANANCGRSFSLLTFPSVGNKLFQPSTLQRSAISVFSLQTPHRSQVQRNSTRSTATTQQERQETKDRMGSCWFHMPQVRYSLVQFWTS